MMGDDMLRTTDPARWRLRTEEGVHYWYYLSESDSARERPQTFAEKYFLNLLRVLNSSNDFAYDADMNSHPTHCPPLHRIKGQRGTV